ncbi:MAG TPA: hypothetical protein VKR06_46450 [Ktedonosporobacter sp.]|nr:hypothetical protein [Ktedonosporobacter sp.]
MKIEGAYLEHRNLADGRAIAVDQLAQGRGLVVIGTRYAGTSWEYSSISEALAAWFDWDPAKSLEPAGYQRRRRIEV